MSLNAKKVGLVIGAIGGGMYGVALDIARRCGSVSWCPEQQQVAQSTDNSYMLFHTAEAGRDLICDGPSDDTLSCQIAQATVAITGLLHFTNMIANYPLGMTLTFAGAALGLALGDALDRCFEIEDEGRLKFN